MSIETLFYTICIILFIINIMYYKSTKNPIKKGLIGAASGIAAMIPTGLFMSMAGLPLALNYTTLLLSALLGIPGVILLVIYTVFF